MVSAHDPSHVHGDHESDANSTYWRAGELGGVELLRTRRSQHSFPRHAHEGLACGVIESGDFGFTSRGHKWVAMPGVSVVVVNPEDVHDGGPLGDAGYDYRMFYIDTPLVTRAIAERGGTERGLLPFFPELMVQDAELARCFMQLHRALERDSGAGRLERETRFLAAVSALVARHSRERPAAHGFDGRLHRSVSRAREYLEAHVADDVSLTELAQAAGVSRFHLLRQFRRLHGLPPHSWFMQHRLRLARRLLHAGETPAAVAAALGFVDQSHLTRRFLALYGVTPGRFRRESNRVQDSGVMRR